MVVFRWEHLEACLKRFDYLLEEEGQSITRVDIGALEAGHNKKQACLEDIENELGQLPPDNGQSGNGIIDRWPAALQEKYFRIVQRLQANLELAERQRDELRQVLDQFDRRLEQAATYSSQQDRAEVVSAVDVEL